MVTAISRLRILDPACGSGAFPMVLLQLLVHVLRKLDKDNVRWKAAKLATLPPEMREMAEQVFREESFDYTRKLELIKTASTVWISSPSPSKSANSAFFSLIIEQCDATHPSVAESRNKIRLCQYASGPPAAQRLGTFPAPD